MWFEEKRFRNHPEKFDRVNARYVQGMCAGLCQFITIVGGEARNPFDRFGTRSCFWLSVGGAALHESVHSAGASAGSSACQAAV